MMHTDLEYTRPETELATPKTVDLHAGLRRFTEWASEVVYMDKTVEQDLRGYDRRPAMDAAISDAGMMDAARTAIVINDTEGYLMALHQLSDQHDFLQTTAEIAVLLYVRARYELCKRVRRVGLRYWDESFPTIKRSLVVAVLQAGRAADAEDPIAYLTEFADEVRNGKTRALTLLRRLYGQPL